MLAVAHLQQIRPILTPTFGDIMAETVNVNNSSTNNSNNKSSDEGEETVIEDLEQEDECKCKRYTLIFNFS